ncbi:PREDICTED: kinesin-like protein Klp68D isoform X2 [Nicrophorus vespilloides]|uniref:Kinesin-like protein n=1 Tax=Nicrophorus vespilloides TaxID=110193 RepID=A0ABM1MNH3_NICVS|nr:PREDICTED: kinesin-like protein Klp68D isoform X2 [Nicrophorus vespilloides]
MEVADGNAASAGTLNPPKSATRSVNNESVQVIVRCRPINQKEEAADCSTVVNVYAQRGVIEVEHPKSKSESKIFTYDGVYDWNSSQQSIYDETIMPLVSSVLEGYNGCVFAYGQTGTGKTFTMEGGGNSEESKGVIPRVFDQIWAHIDRTTGTEFLVSVRYLEIYMEDIRDLLKSKNSKPLELREMSGQGVFVSHLHSQTCQSAHDMLKAMKVGNHNRTTGATNMNEHSSRSHAIFQISIEMAKGDTKSVKVGKLNLIDLAGSERQAKTGATGNRLKEATKINKSLSALGNVIYALAENSSHIPYRDSKLTRLLQDSLGGNSKTIMIANIGPASDNYDETIITLRYAYRAKSIKNQPVKNEDCKDAKLLDLQSEIERLRELIMVKSNGKFDPDATLSVDDIDADAAGSSSDSEAGETEKREREKKIAEGKMEIDELSKKLRTLEKQMVHGGKNIVDSVNENEIQLEKQKSEIAARKKREVEMQQQLELEEESCMELKQVFQTLQQEVDFKREKLKRLHGKLQSVKQEVKDNHENYLKERQDLTEASDDATMHLRQTLLILENFVPSEERSKLLNLAQFNEDTDNWILKKEKRWFNPAERPLAHDYRRPISDYTIAHAIPSTGVRYRAENILDLKLDLPLRTTQEYTRPTVCPQVKAAVKNVIRQDAENNRIVVKLAPHGFTGRGISKTELEGRYNKAARNMVEVNKVKQLPKSAKPVY